MVRPARLATKSGPLWWGRSWASCFHTVSLLRWRVEWSFWARPSRSSFALFRRRWWRLARERTRAKLSRALRAWWAAIAVPAAPSWHRSSVKAKTGPQGAYRGGKRGRSVEGGLRGLRDRHDGLLPGDVDLRSGPERSPSR